MLVLVFVYVWSEYVTTLGGSREKKETNSQLISAAAAKQLRSPLSVYICARCLGVLFVARHSRECITTTEAELRNEWRPLRCCFCDSHFALCLRFAHRLCVMVDVVVDVVVNISCSLLRLLVLCYKIGSCECGDRLEGERVCGWLLSQKVI